MPEGKSAHETYPDLGTPARKQAIIKHVETLRDHVADVLSRGAQPLTIGGDHSMAAGSIAGLAKAYDAYGRIGVLWIDAHADINTMETSPSKALHGMPVAALMGLGDEDYVKACGPKPVLTPENLFYIGLRDVDEGENAFIKKLGVPGYTADEARKKGVREALREGMDTIRKNTDYLFLSFDMDALDPAEVPATGTPVAAGFTSEELLPLLEDLLAQHHFDVLEISEYNPTLDGRDITFRTLKSLLTVFVKNQASLQAAS